MTKSEALQFFGGVTALAKALGITTQAVSQWPDEVPRSRQAELELLTRGVLRAAPRAGQERPGSVDEAAASANCRSE